MGIAFAGSTTSAGAPNVEGGVYDGRFDGVAAKIIANSKYDPNSYEWSFTLLDNGAVLYDAGEPVEVTGLTSQSVNVKSKTTPKAVRWLKAIMTPAEFAQFELGEEPVDADKLVGRSVQLVIAINDNGWPRVDDVLAAKKARSGAIKPTAAAEDA